MPVVAGGAVLADVLAGAGFRHVHECLDGFFVVVLALCLLGGEVLDEGFGRAVVDVAVVLGEEFQLGRH